MKKQLNVSAITNELRGNSAFFPRYKKEPADAIPDHTPLPADHQKTPAPRPVPPVRVVPPVPLVRDVPPSKRIMKQRHPFDIYQDQYEALQNLALEQRKLGGVPRTTPMPRPALDRPHTSSKAAKQYAPYPPYG